MLVGAGGGHWLPFIDGSCGGWVGVISVHW